MDLIKTLDNLLNKDDNNLEVNNNFYSNTKDLDENNIAEKEDDAKSVKDFEYTDQSLELEHENDEFQDCFVFSDDDDRDNDLLSSDEEDLTDEGPLNTETIEQFLKDCENIMTASDEKLNETIENELPEKLNKEENNEVTNATEQKNNINDNNEENKVEKDVESNKLFPEKIIDFYDPDFESLELRINQLWKQIDEIQEQIKTERAFSKEEAKEITEFLSKNNMNNDSLVSNNDYLNDKNTYIHEQMIKNEEKINSKIMETKGTNTFISAQTEARVNAKKELIKRMNIKNKESEANMFKRKLKEVEELCALEMNRVTHIISELHSLQNEKDTLSYENKQETISDKLNYIKNPMKTKSNISLPDATKLKYLTNRAYDNNTTNELNKEKNLFNDNKVITL